MTTNETKNRILKKAYNLFTKYGYSRVSMDHLSSQVGISKKTLYNHFKSKEELLLMAINQYRNELNRDIENVVNDENTDFLRKVKKIFAIAATKLSAIDSNLIQDVYKNAPNAWKVIREVKQEAAFLRFNKLLEEGIEKGYVRKDVKKTLAVILYASTIDAVVNPEFRTNIPDEMQKELPFSTSDVFQGLAKIIFEGILVKN